MRRILLSVLGVLVLLIAVFAIMVSMRPDDYVISRKTVMNAPPEKVFPHVNDFHQWDAWSPWAKRDPNAKNTHSGAESGKGAKFAWAGNSEVGKGQMTIIESKPPEEVLIKIEFTEPMMDKADVKFTFKAVDGKPDQTEVAWTMSGTNNFVGKAFDLMMDMDKMVGTDFEKGLASMKEVVEKPEQPKAPEPAPEPSSAEEKAPAEGETK